MNISSTPTITSKRSAQRNVRIVKLHLRPETNKEPSQHLLNGSGKLEKNLIEMGIIDPEAEVHYLLQAY